MLGDVSGLKNIVYVEFIEEIHMWIQKLNQLKATCVNVHDVVIYKLSNSINYFLYNKCTKYSTICLFQIFNVLKQKINKWW